VAATSLALAPAPAPCFKPSVHKAIQIRQWSQFLVLFGNIRLHRRTTNPFRFTVLTAYSSAYRFYRPHHASCYATPTHVNRWLCLRRLNIADLANY
jgi:hypothetical protein